MATYRERLRSEKLRGRASIFIQCLIFLSLCAFCVETLPDLPSKWVSWLSAFELFTVTVFTIEYFLRIWTAPSPPKYLFSFLGIIDLLAILPFYLALGIDLRSIRILRFFRLIRILKLAKYSRAVDRFRQAFASVREEMTLFLVACAFLIFLSSVGIYYFENPAQPEVFSSIFSAMWWSVATLTTVGYGDVYPITSGGKIFTTLILLIGLGIIAIPAGLIATGMTVTNEDGNHET